MRLSSGIVFVLLYTIPALLYRHEYSCEPVQKSKPVFYRFF